MPKYYDLMIDLTDPLEPCGLAESISILLDAPGAKDGQQKKERVI